jgi:muramoyltetrapeptide carboxypeptidase
LASALRKPRALRSGDRIAIVAPASPFARTEFEAGIAELAALGFEPVYDESVFARDAYVAGPPDVRARAFLAAWDDPSIAALVAARGGYGSVQILPLLDPDRVRRHDKAFIGYSDNTSLLTWLVQSQRLVAFHGPMLEGRFARGVDGYDRDTFERCLCRAEAAGEIRHPRLETLKAGEARGVLVGGTLTQLTASLGTPFAFDPPTGCILFIDEVGERPYRIDRMLTQLRLSGILARAGALVFGELPKCDEPASEVPVRSTVAALTRDFAGPVLFGLPSGHTAGATLTLPFGVETAVVTGSDPALVILEPAVS